MILTIDNTWCEAHRMCWRKGYYRHTLDLTSERTSAPLAFGGAVHAGLAAHRKGKTLEEACAIAIKAWRITPENDDEWRTPEKLLEVLSQYFANPNTAVAVCKGRDGTPLVEVDAMYPLLSLDDRESVTTKLAKLGYSGVMYVGLIDLVAEWMGEPTLFDTKTTSLIYTPKDGPSSIRPDFWQNYVVNPQIRGYLWILSQYTERPMLNAVIDAIGLSKNNPRNCFERRDFLFTPSQIEEWREDTVNLVERYLDCVLEGYFPMNGAPYYCHSYHSPCLYAELCSVPNEVRAQKDLETMFKKDKWIPTEARKKEAAGEL